MALALVREAPEQRGREVLEFGAELGLEVRAYEPDGPGDYWRLRWREAGGRRDTTARSREEAVAKAADVVERLARGLRTDLARATGADLVAHYLDPGRKPPKCDRWSDKHRDAQQRWCERHVLPEIAGVPCARLGPVDFQRVLDRARTKSVAEHLRRCVTGLVNAGLEDGYLLARQDVLRGVRWAAASAAGAGPSSVAVEDWLAGDDAWLDEEDPCRAITEDEVPTTELVHALAAAAAAVRGVWWRELEVLLSAYSGLRWGEHAALQGARVDPDRRVIAVRRQLIEVGGELRVSLPKGRHRRTTVYPATTPGGADLAAMVARRVEEVGPGGLLFPSPRGRPARRSNYGRNIWTPAAEAAGWPRRADGRWLWTWHSKRHVFVTWALFMGIPIADVSRFVGHSSTRVTEEVYAHVHGDVHERFRAATK